MEQIVTAYFDNVSDAERARDSLVAAGINRSQISLVPGAPASTAGTGQKTQDDEPQEQGGFWAALKDLFVPEEDRHTYAEALSRGGVMLTVQMQEAAVDQVEEILENAGAVDMHERAAAWQSQGGWKGYPGQTSGHAEGGAVEPTSLAPGSSTVTGQRGGTREEAIPVVEEQLRVGKRLASQGRVRVRSYVVETPIREQVSLREERVQVDRRPVDRPVAGSDHPFQDRTIEAEATREEAVVAKQARVKEEVVLKKNAKQRTETVADTVRRTEVKVEDERAPSAAGPRR